jgi:zinc and cadmium transporter
MLTVLFFSLIGGVLSLVGGIILLSKKSTADGLAKYATPFAAGVLLAAALVSLIPEALEASDDISSVMTYVLIGILFFFFLERFLRWFHHHHEDESKGKATNSLIIIGDTLHNALDGIAIGAAFLIDVPTGIIATAAVAAHEIPQEIGDFGLLLKNGMSRKNVLLVNIFSAFATSLTAVLTFWLGDSENFPLSALLAITAGFFIYISTSDIIPEIHDEAGGNKKDIRPWLLLIGALMVVVISPIAHEYIDAGHEHEHSSEHSELEHHDEHEEDHVEFEQTHSE